MLPEVNRRRRGHAFYPPKDVARKVPPLGGAEDQGEDAVAHMHYFSPSGDWYVTEWDPENGLVFGWAELMPGCGEWGYSSLPEMESVYVPPFGIIERDMYWTPQPMSEVLATRRYR